jgi:hypothetical protein
MGKSSLRVRTMQRLPVEGFSGASIDLIGIGKNKPEIIYLQILLKFLASSDG